MKYGAFVNILESNRHSWNEQFDFVASLQGLDHVELWVENVPSTPDFVFLKNKFSQVAGRSILIHAPFVGVSLASHDENLRKASVSRVIESARLGEALGAAVLTCHSGMVGAWVKQIGGLNRLAQSLHEIITETNIQVAIENMPARYGGARELVTTADDLLYLLDAVAKLKVTLDVGHSIQNGEDPYESVSRLGSGNIANVHVHDGSEHGSAHRALGAGSLDTYRLLLQLTKQNYSGYVSLETLGEDDTRKSWNLITNLRIELDGNSANLGGIGKKHEQSA